MGDCSTFINSLFEFKEEPTDLAKAISCIVQHHCQREQETFLKHLPAALPIP
eukprot:m.109465 g.109465  ORF g.109465 m.109465 type:complete len:52 (+) comp14002_c1_seq16:1455-1610(+)